MTFPVGLLELYASQLRDALPCSLYEWLDDPDYHQLVADRDIGEIENLVFALGWVRGAAAALDVNTCSLLASHGIADSPE